MLSLFPPPGPPLPPFSSLLVQGSCHPSAPIHLAISHVLQSPKHEALVISPSPSEFKQKLSSVFDQGFMNTNRMKTAMSRIIIIYPPSPAHLCLLITTLDGTQFASELTCLWGGLAVSPTEDLSLIILDDISALFKDTDRDPPALSFISIMNRLWQAISRITAKRGPPSRSGESHVQSPISVACFETTIHGHLEGVKRDLFRLIVEFQELEVSSGPGEKRVRKSMSTVEGDERTSIEYIESMEFIWK